LIISNETTNSVIISFKIKIFKQMVSFVNMPTYLIKKQLKRAIQKVTSVSG
jgi:hypothetical protein